MVLCPIADSPRQSARTLGTWPRFAPMSPKRRLDYPRRKRLRSDDQAPSERRAARAPHFGRPASPSRWSGDESAASSVISDREATEEYPRWRRRLPVAVQNVGGPRSDPVRNKALEQNLGSSPATILILQECTVEHHEMLSLCGWIGGGVYHGLAVFAKQPLATRVDYLYEYRTAGGGRRVSRYIIAKITWHPTQRILGEKYAIVANGHIHNEHATTQVNYVAWVSAFLVDIYNCGRREDGGPVMILGVDANMRLYSLGPALAGRSSDPVERGMIAKSTRRSPDFDKRGLRIAGIFL